MPELSPFSEATHDHTQAMFNRIRELEAENGKLNAACAEMRAAIMKLVGG